MTLYDPTIEKNNMLAEIERLRQRESREAEVRGLARDLTVVLGKRNAEIERLRAALTPSADTKAAYSGEFHFNIAQIDEFGDEGSLRVVVPWTTVKEIMAAIRKYADEQKAPAKTGWTKDIGLGTDDAGD